MEEDDYHLKWAKHHEAFISMFSYLYSKEILVDCALTAEDKYIKAHKIVLMACSPYLQELLNAHSADYPIIFLDIKYSELQAILHFCYNGEVTISHNELDGFIEAATLLKIKGLTGKELDSEGQLKRENECESNGDDEDTTEETSQRDGAFMDEDRINAHQLSKYMACNYSDAMDEQGSDNTEGDSDESSNEDEDLENMDVTTYLPSGGNIIFPWTCSRCGEAFPTRVLHDQHRKTCVVHKDLPWKCKQCPNTYKNKKDLVRHLNYCGKVTPRLKCYRCGSTYKYVRGLNRHLKYCGKDVKPLKCPDCDKQFKYPRGLRRHQRRCGIIEALAKLAQKGVTPVLIRKNSRSKEDNTFISAGFKQEIQEDFRGGDKHLKESVDLTQTPPGAPSICGCGKVYKYRRSFLRHVEYCPKMRHPEKTTKDHGRREAERRVITPKIDRLTARSNKSSSFSSADSDDDDDDDDVDKCTSEVIVNNGDEDKTVNPKEVQDLSNNNEKLDGIEDSENSLKIKEEDPQEITAEKTTTKTVNINEKKLGAKQSSPRKMDRKNPPQSGSSEDEGMDIDKESHGKQIDDSKKLENEITTSENNNIKDTA